MRCSCLVAASICCAIVCSKSLGQEPAGADRDAAKQAQNTNNLKQLALGLLNYHSAQKHFPPAAVIGPDGQTKHSWRVEILRYVQENALYKEYRLDEPWDSENNKKLLEKMPDVFRSPYADKSSTNTAYFMLTGEGMIGGSEKGTTIRQIRDGTSKTFLLVEAKRDIPWTKPEDIEIAPDETKPLSKLGGFNQYGTFTVAFADGSVRQVDEKLDPAKLRAFFTMAGGEVIDPALTQTRIIGRKDEP
jgi:Protein of unknown function (DUF1559)